MGCRDKRGLREVPRQNALLWEIGTKGGQGGVESEHLPSRGVGTKGGQSGVAQLWEIGTKGCQSGVELKRSAMRDGDKRGSEWCWGKTLRYERWGQKGVRVVLSQNAPLWETGTKGGQSGAESKCLARRGIETKRGQGLSQKAWLQMSFRLRCRKGGGGRK